MNDSENTEREPQAEQQHENVPEPEKIEESSSESSETKDDSKKNVASNDNSDGHHHGWKQKSHGGKDMSFEEKLRSFKKQSEERLLHIKRSREAKIGKKKTR